MVKWKCGIITFLVALLLSATSGCKTTGYTYRVETPTVTFGTIEKIESLVIEKGYVLTAKEKLRYEGAPDNDVTTIFQKRFDHPEWWRYIVFVTEFYVKDTERLPPRQVRIDVYNHNVGLVVPEIKAEIDSLGELISKAVVEEVGAPNVRIQRLEWGPPGGI
jgi:hypothetical protein